MGFENKFNTISNICLWILIFFGSLIYADSNGIWHDAKDLRGGIFGDDEQDVTSSFTFMNPVYFTNSVKMSNTLLINTSLNRGIWSESSVDDGIVGVSSAAGKAAVYGLAKEGSYSGYFEGGDFIVNSDIYGGNIYSNGEKLISGNYVNNTFATINYVNSNSGGNLTQTSCKWKYTDTCGHFCGAGTSKTALCAEGEYVAGFGINTWNSNGRYDTRIYCCQG